MDIESDCSTPTLYINEKEKMSSKNHKIKIPDNRKGRRKGENWDVAKSIRWLPKVMVKFKQAKAETMRELEKMRADADIKEAKQSLIADLSRDSLYLFIEVPEMPRDEESNNSSSLQRPDHYSYLQSVPDRALCTTAVAGNARRRVEAKAKLEAIERGTSSVSVTSTNLGFRDYLQELLWTLGGRKATIIIGYGLPLKDVLFEGDDGKRYPNSALDVRLLKPCCELFQVALPEGSKNPSVLFPVNRSRKENLARAIEHECCGIHQPLMNAIKKKWIYCLQLGMRQTRFTRADLNLTPMSQRGLGTLKPSSTWSSHDLLAP
ncbi:hypothetical protein Tco_0838292 [Tanacetum coccineum]|uniref:Uncharacterized protein n=1 Tax=Tanacetum coccineum TaxID=301880 RepID=A0ABQ5AMD2_9ASTR